MQYLTKIMLDTLQFFYAIGGHNYGLAIIWLTVAVNLALYPLTLTSIKQMAKMQKIQPRMQELQKKHKDDPAKAQKEIMDLYKSEGVNPLGGCLPTLLKLPFFLALFFALQSQEFKLLLGSAGLGGASFLWMSGLAAPDKLNIMPVLIGATTWLMQKTLPSGDAQAKTLNMIMPIMITVISIPFPSGVQLYWITSNLMGAVQQYYILGKPVGGQRDKKEDII